MELKQKTKKPSPTAVTSAALDAYIKGLNTKYNLKLSTKRDQDGEYGGRYQVGIRSRNKGYYAGERYEIMHGLDFEGASNEYCCGLVSFGNFYDTLPEVISHEDRSNLAALMLDWAAWQQRRPYLQATTLDDNQQDGRYKMWNDGFAKSVYWRPHVAIKSIHGDYPIYLWEFIREA